MSTWVLAATIAAGIGAIGTTVTALRLAALRREDRVSAKLEPTGELGLESNAGVIGENTSFSDDERAKIASQLRVIRDELGGRGELTAVQLGNIDARLDDAEKASRRLGRKDWLLLFVGSLTSAMLADAIAPDTANEILAAALKAQRSLLDSPRPMLPLAHDGDSQAPAEQTEHGL